MAGIHDVPATDLSGITADIDAFDLPRPFALLVPGGAKHRPSKRWPAERVGVLAKILADQRIEPVLLGTAQESDFIAAIRRICPKARSLEGRTDFAHIVALAREALVAVGNDTGPMHLIATAGCPSVVLFSRDSAPRLCAPRAPRPGGVAVLNRDDLTGMTVEEVMAALRDVCRHGGAATPIE